MLQHLVRILGDVVLRVFEQLVHPSTFLPSLLIIKVCWIANNAKHKVTLRCGLNVLKGCDVSEWFVELDQSKVTGLEVLVVKPVGGRDDAFGCVKLDRR